MALPSIRVGYAISKKDNIDMIDAVKAPYSVSTISQIAAKIAIDNFDLYKGQIKMIVNERERLYKELVNLGFDVYPSEANFIYVLFDDKYNEALLQNKIYIRKFKSWASIHNTIISKKKKSCNRFHIIWDMIII